jgi:arylsulfatase A-like enzyme
MSPARLLPLLALLTVACGEDSGATPAAGAPPGAAQPVATPAAGSGAAMPAVPGVPAVPGADPVHVEVTALDIIECFARGDERLEVLAQDPGRPLYCGPGNFEKLTQLASDEDHKVIGARADSAFEITAGPFREGAQLLARTFVYSAFPKDPARADPAPITFRILVNGVEAVALRSDYILQPGPSEHPYDTCMRTFEIPLDGAAGGPVTLRFETTRLGAPAPDPEVPIPETIWWDLRVEQLVPVPRAAADRRHPNVLVLLVDTLSARHMSLHGYHRPTTPQLQAFAARGLRFDRALSASSWTMPAVASLLTGLSPNEHGVLGGARNYLVDGVVTWPEALRAQGIEGAAFVANTLISRANNFQQGFGSWVQANDETAEQLNARLLEWLDSQPAGARWFGYVHYMDPHAPYGAPGAARDRFAADAPAPAELSHIFPEQIQRGELAPPDEATRAQIVNLYDAEIAYFDACFGALVAALEQRGRLDDTLVLLTADHGEELFEHGMLGHGYTLYDELLHVPLVVAGPGIRSGDVRADPVSTAAVASLILGQARVPQLPDALPMSPPPAAGAGSAFVFASVRTALFGPQRHLVAAQDARYKAICVLDEQGVLQSCECFDLRADPLEQHPLASGACALQQGAAFDWAAATAARRLPEPQPLNPDIEQSLLEIGYIGGGAGKPSPPKPQPPEPPAGTSLPEGQTPPGQLPGVEPSGDEQQ